MFLLSFTYLQVYTAGNLTANGTEIMEAVDDRIYDYISNAVSYDEAVNFTTNWLAVITWYNVEPFGSDLVSNLFISTEPSVATIDNT